MDRRGGKEEVALFLSWVAFKTVEAYELVNEMIPATEYVAPFLACLERIQFGFSRLTVFFSGFELSTRNLALVHFIIPD